MALLPHLIIWENPWKDWRAVGLNCWAGASQGISQERLTEALCSSASTLLAPGCETEIEQSKLQCGSHCFRFETLKNMPELPWAVSGWCFLNMPLLKEIIMFCLNSFLKLENQFLFKTAQFTELNLCTAAHSVTAVNGYCCFFSVALTTEITEKQNKQSN